MRLSVSARTPDYGPAAGARVKAELVSEDGRSVARAEGVAGPDGVAQLELTPPGPGAYKVAAAAESRGEGVETAAGAVAVRSSGTEDADAAPRPDLLRALAEATGGGFAALPGRAMPEVALSEPEVVEVGRRKDVPFWDRGWFLLGLCLSLGAEWVLRRRWGWW